MEDIEYIKHEIDDMKREIEKISDLHDKYRRLEFHYENLYFEYSSANAYFRSLDKVLKGSLFSLILYWLKYRFGMIKGFMWYVHRKG